MKQRQNENLGDYLRQFNNAKDTYIEGDIKYSHNNFILRQTICHRYPSNSSGGVFYFRYTLIIFGGIEASDIESKLTLN